MTQEDVTGLGDLLKEKIARFRRLIVHKLTAKEIKVSTIKEKVPGGGVTAPNLTSIQSLAVTLADAGADTLFGWDDTADAYENLSKAEALAVLNVADGADVTGANAPKAHKASHTDGTDDIQTATTAQKGVVSELATAAEAATGTDSSRVVTPSLLPVLVQDSKYAYAADAEASDTYAITLTPAIGAYAVGQVFHFKANTANTGAATLNVNAKGAITIKKNHDADLADNDIEAGQIVAVVYAGTNFQMQSQLANAAAGGGANHDILDGSVHQDSVADGVTRGSLIYGNATPKWDELVIGAAGAALVSDGTDASWVVPKRTILLTAAGGSPTTTAGCSEITKVEFGTNDVDVWVLDFNKDTEEHGFWNFVWPDNVDGGTVATAKFYWTSASAGGSVVWGIEGLSLGDTESIDTAHGTERTVTDATNQNDVNITGATSGDFFQSPPTDGEWVQIRVARKAADGSDTHGSDARLLAVKIEYSTDSYSD